MIILVQSLILLRTRSTWQFPDTNLLRSRASTWHHFLPPTCCATAPRVQGRVSAEGAWSPLYPIPVAGNKTTTHLVCGFGRLPVTRHYFHSKAQAFLIAALEHKGWQGLQRAGSSRRLPRSLQASSTSLTCNAEFGGHLYHVYTLSSFI